MKFSGRRRSSNVEDRRGQRVNRSGGSVPLLGMLMSGMSFKGIILVVVVLLVANGLGLGNMFNSSSNVAPLSAQRHDELYEFVTVVLADTEDVWHELFQKEGLVYKEPTLVVFENEVSSACGFQSSAVGPFYCPSDQKIYIDLSFYDELSNRFGASGDFAMAYVVAHEVGHHVQTLLGINEQMNKIRQQVSQTEYNRYSVAFELQADYLSGVWAHHVFEQGLLEEGDIDEALRAANAIGDDAIQKQAQGYVVPDSFTHGTSQQRKYWFYHGFEMGDLEHGDTFSEIIG